jgi:hypothetical protein
MGIMKAAGSGFVLQDGGCFGSASFTPTATAYSAADVMDVAKAISLTFADGSPIPAGAMLRIQSAVLKIDATALQASEAAYMLYLYSITPPSAQADNAAFTLASADLPYYLGSVSLGTPVDMGAALYVKTGNLTEDIKLDAGLTSIYAQLVTVAGFTPTAVARQVQLRGSVL